ncbi:MAG: hypothetical protein HQL70_09345 [Magnetococcales bacterium]|nr:hypothetical protein [Magnetococcales bacterium]
MAQITSSRWRVGVQKIYPESGEKNWVIIQGRRIGVGSSVLGGQVIYLGEKRLEIQQGHERRVLNLFDCSATSAEKAVWNGEDSGAGCHGRFFMVEKWAEF